MAQKYSEEFEKIIIDEYKKGYGCTTISKKYKISGATVHRILQRNNIKSRTHAEAQRKYNFDENYFENIDTEDKAYWLGFIYADGALIEQQYGNALKIDLSITDIEHLRKIKNCMRSDIYIPTYKSSGGYCNNTEYVRFKLVSGKLCNDLESHGVYYNKTLILEPPCISEDLIPHFIRGYIDGDGCITSYLPKNHNKRSYSIKVVGTLEILDFIKKYIEENSTIKINKYYYRKKDSKVATLEIGGNLQVEKVLNLFYKDAKMFLDRKYELYLKVLKNNIVPCSSDAVNGNSVNCNSQVCY